VGDRADGGDIEASVVAKRAIIGNRSPQLIPAIDAVRLRKESPMTQSPAELERRSGEERRRDERRKLSVPVAVELRSGTDRRERSERRLEAESSTR
jgi:hypothetical protein